MNKMMLFFRTKTFLVIMFQKKMVKDAGLAWPG